MPRQKRKAPRDPLVRAIVLSILLCGVLALFVATLPGDWSSGGFDTPRDDRPAARAPTPASTSTTVSVPPMLGGEAIESSTTGRAGAPSREGFTVVPRRVPSVVVGPDGKIIPR